MKFFLILLACAVVGVLAVGAGLVLTHDVDTHPTDADSAAWEDLLAPRGETLDRLQKKIDRNGFDGLIDAMILMQDILVRRMTNDNAIPPGMTREPADLLIHVNASCGDRARTLAKGAALVGVTARHVFVRGTDPQDGRVRSHAAVEIDTPRGPLLIDTNTRWMALAADGSPTGYRQWQAMTQSARVGFATDPRIKGGKSHKVQKGPYRLLLADDVWMIPGLYSVHGQFYPPFTPYVPDVDLETFVGLFITP